MKQSLKQTEKVIYMTPSCEILNLFYEGVICASGDADVEDWEEDDDPISI